MSVWTSTTTWYVTPPAHDDDPVHLVDEDPDVALCGADTSDMPWVDPTLGQVCPACAAIEEAEGMVLDLFEALS